MKKLLERKFAIPGLAGLLPVANEVAGMNLPFRVLALVAATAISWATIEACLDVARMKYGKAEAPKA